METEVYKANLKAEFDNDYLKASREIKKFAEENELNDFEIYNQFNDLVFDKIMTSRGVIQQQVAFSFQNFSIDQAISLQTYIYGLESERFAEITNVRGYYLKKYLK